MTISAHDHAHSTPTAAWIEKHATPGLIACDGEIYLSIRDQEDRMSPAEFHSFLQAGLLVLAEATKQAVELLDERIDALSGAELATADDVIEGRAKYADTPGGKADRSTLRDEQVAS